MATWHKSDFKGVRYRKHLARRHGVQYDRYYVLTYKLDGKTKTEAVGWASDGVKPLECFKLLCQLKENQRTGSGPRTLSDMREAEKARQDADKRKRREADRKNVSLRQFFDRAYSADAAFAKKLETFRKEQEHVRNWIDPVTGDTPMRELGLEHVKKIRADLARKGRAPRTQQYVMRTFTTVWNAALDAGLVAKPCPTKSKSFRLPRVANAKDRYLTTSEAELLLEAVKAKNDQVHAMTYLSLYTGMRFSEVARLTWGCVDLETQSVRVLGAKHDKDRAIPMTEEVAELFENMEAGQPNELVFPNSKGQVQRQVPSAFKRAVAETGLNEGVAPRDRVGFHTLRHTKASWMVKAEVDLYRVQRILGHGTPSQTQRYAHLVDHDLRKAILKEEAHRRKGDSTIIPFPTHRNQHGRE